MTDLVPVAHPVDLWRFWPVAIVAVTVYVAAAAIVVRRLRAWLLARRTARSGAAVPAHTRPRSRLRRVVDIAVLVAAGLGLVALAWAYHEPYTLDVTTVRVPLAKLPAGSPPIRIVQISDVHSDDRARLEEEIPAAVAGLRPDAIVFTGDAVNQDGGLPHFRKLMRALAAIAPTFAVRGNWDVWWFAHLRPFDDTGVRVLDGEAVPLPIGAHRVWLVGAPVEGHELLWPALAVVPREDLSVVLFHYPDVGARALELGADLALAGDTHGGQVRLPLLGPLIRIRRFGPYREAGLHRIAGGYLYVSRGIGMEGGWAPRVRFLCPPEVTLLELVP